MAKRSLKASTLGIEKAKRAFERTGWTQEYLAAEVGLSTRQSVWKFFSGRAIERHIFIDICFQLNLDWQEIADLPYKISSEKLELERENTANNSELEELIQIARSHLQRQIQSQCGTLQSSFEFAKPLKLEHIYTDIDLLTQLSSQRWLEVSDLQNRGSSKRLSLSTTEPNTISILDAIAQFDKLVILGKPGAGKTTLLQHLALQCIEGKFKDRSIPVFISLRSLALIVQNTPNFNWLDYLAKIWNCEKLDRDRVQIMLQNGKVLLLLDGLDEIPQQFNDLLAGEIQQFAEFYYQNQIVVTCRLAAQQLLFRGFTQVEIADFNSDRIETFAQKWFVATANDSASGLTKAKQFLEQLQHQENLPIRELVATPILLSLVCSVFQEKCSFPTKRAKLYREGLEILLVRWDRARGIQRDRTYEHLSLADKIRLLSQIAAITFDRGDYFVEKAEILQIIADFLRENSPVDVNSEALLLDSEAVLKAIEIQHGLLIERARGIYSFSHLTFHEYLTARKIVSGDRELTNSLQQLAQHTTEPQWREVILLTVSMLPNADFLLQQIQDRVELILKNELKLQHFLNFISEKANSLTLLYKASAVRAFYFSLWQNRDLSLAISLDINLASELHEDLALDLGLARALINTINLVENPSIDQIIDFNFAFDLERSFKLNLEMQADLEILKTQLPDLELGKKYLINWWENNGFEWVKKFQNLIVKHRYREQNWYFNRAQQKLLQQYYTANRFLVECLQSDCKISEEIAIAIEQKIMMPVKSKVSSEV
jgi:predicted NACHT family NTPase